VGSEVLESAFIYKIGVDDEYKMNRDNHNILLEFIRNNNYYLINLILNNLLF
jgi:hypothetical protein